MKKLKSIEQFIFEKYENKLFEGKVEKPKNGFKKIDIENLLRKHRDLEIKTDDGTSYFITPYMHINGKIDNATDKVTYAVDKKGKEAEIEYSSISSIHV